MVQFWCCRNVRTDPHQKRALRAQKRSGGFASKLSLSRTILRSALEKLPEKLPAGAPPSFLIYRGVSRRFLDPPGHNYRPKACIYRPEHLSFSSDYNVAAGFAKDNNTGGTIFEVSCEDAARERCRSIKEWNPLATEEKQGPKPPNNVREPRLNGIRRYTKAMEGAMEYSFFPRHCSRVFVCFAKRCCTPGFELLSSGQ